MLLLRLLIGCQARVLPPVSMWKPDFWAQISGYHADDLGDPSQPEVLSLRVFNKVEASLLVFNDGVTSTLPSLEAESAPVEDYPLEEIQALWIPRYPKLIPEGGVVGELVAQSALFANVQSFPTVELYCVDWLLKGRLVACPDPFGWFAIVVDEGTAEEQMYVCNVHSLLPSEREKLAALTPRP